MRVYNRGITREITIWKATFKDGKRIRIEDCSRKEALTFINNSNNIDKHGYLLKLEKVK